MSSAHRPTWEPAKGKGDIAHLSQAFSKHSLPAHTKLKFRRPGDTQRRSLQELKAELEAGERRAKAARNPDADDADEDEGDAKRRKLLEDAKQLDADDDEAPPSKSKQPAHSADDDADDANDDDDDDEEDEDESEDDDDDEDDTEALMRELEKIKQERREEQERREQLDSAQEQMTREEEIARGNPLLNLENALHGESRAPKMPEQQRWDEDLIFRNQAVETPDLTKRGFVNDLTRTCATTHPRHGIPQKVYECTWRVPRDANLQRYIK